MISVNRYLIKQNNDAKNEFQKFIFDGSCSKKGSGDGVFLISPTNEVISLSFKLELRTTSNVAEYEALVAGFQTAKNLKIENI